MDLLFIGLGELLQSEVAKMTFAFLIAARLHANWVKKEFAMLRQSIDHVAEATGKRLDGFDQRIKQLEEEK